MKRDDQRIKQLFDEIFPVASDEQMESARKRAWQSLRHLPADTVRSSQAPLPVKTAIVPSDRRRMVLLLMPVAGAIILGFITVRMFRNTGTRPGPALVQSLGGGLHRVSDGESLKEGGTISIGEGVRTDNGLGSVVSLADGSRIEVRAHSAFSLERSSDGTLIDLHEGGVIVSATKQRSGHLYVRTKDLTVSVVGTVFLVSAGDAGSRVAVIQGGVQVQEGSAVKRLLPGEQIATNPLMETHPIAQEVSWSRTAPAHIALLQQAAASTAQHPQDGAAAPVRAEFEVGTVKPAGPGSPLPSVACRGTDGVLSLIRLQDWADQLAPQGRCVGIAFLRELIGIAYEIRADRISGDEPAMYQIEGKASEPSSATKEDLRQMLQNFVIDRFNVKAHRETTEGEGYVLRVSKRGPKLKEASGDEEGPKVVRTPGPPPALGGPLPIVIEAKCRLKTFADYLSSLVAGRTVIDRTDLTGIYEIHLALNRLPGVAGPRGGGGDVPEYEPSLSDAIEDQLGLRLEARKVPIEYLVVDHIGKPTAN